ncbi:MAG: lipid II flippase MurJ [Candidatus Roizmanbacteria bacterium]|nr:lipid II flippase MurJ [Candidatus Roizmanbacteria bacterium]
MIKKSMIVTGIFIVSTFIQLASQIVVTRIFGARLDLDIFLAAVSIPTIMVTVIYGTLNQAFLPLLGEQKTHKKDVDSYFFSHLIVFSLITIVASIIIGFFTELISSSLYSSRGEDFIQHVALQMRILFYALPLGVVATMLGTYLYVHKKFYRFPLAQTVGSIVNLAIILVLHQQYGIWSLVIGFSIGIFAQIFIVIPSTIGRMKLKLTNPLPLLLAWLPLIVGSFAVRSDILIIRSFGSQLPTGYLVYLNLISKIFSLAAGVMTVGIQIVYLPHLVEQIASKKFEQSIASINQAKVYAIVVSIVVVIAVWIVSPFIIPILFVGGKFSITDAQTTISLIPLFILPGIGWGISSIFFQPLLVLKKYFTLGVLNISSLFFAWTGALIINHYYGPLFAIAGGLTILLLIGILGSELIWRHYRKKLHIL